MPGLITETNVKFASVLFTAFAGIAGLFVNSCQANRIAALEARRPFIEKQLELCFDATNAVASIAANVDGPNDGEAPLDTFSRLYLGKLALVEDRPVACAMTRFAELVRLDLMSKDGDEGAADWLDARTEQVTGCKEPDDGDKQALQKAAIDLAGACRRLIILSWGAELPVDNH